MTNDSKNDAALAASDEKETTTPTRTPVQAKGNAPVPANSRSVIGYTNRNGQQVTVPLGNIQSIDEVVPSGTWDVPQRKRDDIQDEVIYCFDAIKMDGQHGPFCVVLCAEKSTVDEGDPELFSVAFNNVPFNKIRRAQGFDEDGREVGRNQLPVVGKLVMVAGASGNSYWDFRDASWVPTV